MKYSLILISVFQLLIQHGLAQDTNGTINIAPFRKCYEDITGCFYDHRAMDLQEQGSIPFSRFKGKVLLVVNVASF